MILYLELVSTTTNLIFMDRKAGFPKAVEYIPPLEDTLCS